MTLHGKLRSPTVLILGPRRIRRAAFRLRYMTPLEVRLKQTGAIARQENPTNYFLECWKNGRNRIDLSF
jgi:hypothetical protein